MEELSTPDSCSHQGRAQFGKKFSSMQRADSQVHRPHMSRLIKNLHHVALCSFEYNGSYIWVANQRFTEDKPMVVSVLGDLAAETDEN
ncbi:hypothetical protein CHS0354_022065 [Potamilus streckersoni]|uniref:Uncharacterized protein n=1 Tax=Potamilus streckersoni TaxID=2493646 RepID=A0AAE0W0L7_9BIVA|nr:hypothetical protein CHS0354_022065 [Potamilus streckersoni]